MTCGEGTQSRTVQCSRDKSNIVPLPLDECDGDVPADTRACYLQPCPPASGCDVSLEARVTSTSISSPNYPANYPSDLECPTVIRATEGNHVEITFTDFVLEGSCNYDYVSVSTHYTKGNCLMLHLKCSTSEKWEGGGGEGGRCCFFSCLIVKVLFCMFFLLLKI